MFKAYVLVLIAAIFSQCTFSEIIKSEKCFDKKTKQEIETITNVFDVRVSPCPSPGDGSTGSPCVLKRGNVATLSVDFSPKVPVHRLRASLAYIRPTLDLPFPSLETNGCKSLTNGTCPLEVNKNYTWTAEVKLAKTFPANRYPLRMKLTDGHHHHPKNLFCETFTIDLQ